jgi:hypothetical protein
MGPLAAEGRGKGLIHHHLLCPRPRSRVVTMLGVRV